MNITPKDLKEFAPEDNKLFTPPVILASPVMVSFSRGVKHFIDEAYGFHLIEALHLAKTTYFKDGWLFHLTLVIRSGHGAIKVSKGGRGNKLEEVGAIVTGSFGDDSHHPSDGEWEFIFLNNSNGNPVVILPSEKDLFVPDVTLDDDFWARVAKKSDEHAFMSGVERSDERVRQNGECFTPTNLVVEVLSQLPPESFLDPTKTYCDPTCGDGQFLVPVKWAKMFCGASLEQALSTIFGVELNADNAEVCRKRLLDGHEEFRHIVEKNIVVADGLTYHYEFDGSDPLILTMDGLPDFSP